MQQGLVSFTGVVAPKGATYTQTLGVDPDVCLLTCQPQVSNIPSTGTVTFSYNSGSITLPNAHVDNVSMVVDGAHGFLTVIRILDRRHWWQFAAPVSGAYNIRRGGTQVAAKKLSLQALASLLFTALGESADVSLLSTSIFPEVHWQHESPADALERLLHEFGFSVALGYGAEAPTVVQIGVGSTPATTNGMLVSQTIDPQTKPRYVRTAFGESLAQVRLLLEPVAQETDGSWVALNSASYKPSGGWETEAPERLPTVEINETEATYNAAIGSVFRAFRVSKFAAGSTGTLNIPDGSGTLSSIEQVLPLRKRLLDNESIRSDGSPIPFRVYGQRNVTVAGSGQPPQTTTSALDDEITGEKVVFDGENGLLVFERPQYYVSSGEFKPAILFLECTIGITNASTFIANSYAKDIEIDAAGTGYRTVKYPEAEARTVVAYGASQAVSGTSNNQTALDALATAIASSVAGQYSTTGQSIIVYNQPVLSLRCNGKVHQVQHVISDGTRRAGSYSTASINQQFDRFILTRDERMVRRNAALALLTERAAKALRRRRDRADDQ